MKSQKPIIMQTPPHHPVVPFTREVYVGKEALSAGELHVAVHHVLDAENVHEPYALPHKHDVEEINILIGFSRDKPLKYTYTIDGESYEVESPASVLIPPNTEHSAVASEGSGIFICMVKKSELP